jgi:hypothetical protein
MEKLTRTRMWELGNKKPDVYTYNEEIAWKKEIDLQGLDSYIYIYKINGSH